MFVLLQESQDGWLDTDFGFAWHSASIVQDVFLSLSAGTWTVLYSVKGPDHFHVLCPASRTRIEMEINTSY